MRISAILALVVALLALPGMTGCGASAPPLPPENAAANSAARPDGPPPPFGKYIKHVVIVIQENRSFNNFFLGYPGALTQKYGYLHTGAKVTLHQTGFSPAIRINHGYKASVHAYDNGKMDGFDLDTYDPGGELAGTAPYAYVDRAQVAPYWSLAQQYVLADHMFPTMNSASFTGHLGLIAGTMNLNPQLAVIDVPSKSPWGCDAPDGTTTPTISAAHVYNPSGPYPCFTQFRTLADDLNAAKISWRYYAPSIASGDPGAQIWSPYDAIASIRKGPTWANVVSPQTLALTAPARGALAPVTWVVPDWKDSDHSWAGSDTGPSWVANIVNAVGRSAYWKSTAILVVWDDWGGFYDPVKPPQLDFRGLGIRVPFLLISPYAKKGYVSHTQYEFGSILKFVTQVFGLPPIGPSSLGYTDRRAAGFADCFDFTKPPRTFKPIAAKYPAAYFLHRAPSLQPVDTE